MTELDKLMERLERLEDELVSNRDFLAKTHSLCFDEKTKEDVTACINSKLDLINWIRDLVKVIQADSQLSKERESSMGIWDKAVLSAEFFANQLANAMIVTSNIAYDEVLAAKRKETFKLIDACNKFRSAMAAIDEDTYKFTDKEKEND